MLKKSVINQKSSNNKKAPASANTSAHTRARLNACTSANIRASEHTDSSVSPDLAARIRQFYDLLEPDSDSVKWLDEYIATPAMQNLKHISTTCGTFYTKLSKDQHAPYSALDHSIGVALIVWHFTRDKKQTLSGLFHDIATPTFKHCVDFLNGDYLTQESTEDLTTYLIENSPEIMSLLKRDGINISEVDNYHLYPIADNDTPKLSADRLEYTLSNGVFIYETFDLAAAKRFYNDLVVAKDEQGIDELTFKHKAPAVDFIKATSRLSVIYRDERTRFSMQFIADILKSLSNKGQIEKADLYKMKESEVIDLIAASEYSEIWKTWREATQLTLSDEKPENVYSVNIKAKVRYIDPLVLLNAKSSAARAINPAPAPTIVSAPAPAATSTSTPAPAPAPTATPTSARISALDRSAKKSIEANLGYSMDKYLTLGFQFEPYEKELTPSSALPSESEADLVSAAGQPLPDSLEEGLLV